MDTVKGIAGLCLVAALFGLALRSAATPPTETEIITRAAEAYQRETGGALTDCQARPSDVENVALVVLCDPPGGARRVYLLDAWGGRIDLPTVTETLLAEDRT